MDDRRDEPVVGRNRDRHVDVLVLSDRAFAPRRVDARVLAQRGRDSLHEQVGVRDSVRVALGGVESRRVDLAPQVEMRHVLPAACHALGHRAPARARRESRGSMLEVRRHDRPVAAE